MTRLADSPPRTDSSKLRSLLYQRSASRAERGRLKTEQQEQHEPRALLPRTNEIVGRHSTRAMREALAHGAGRAEPGINRLMQPPSRRQRRRTDPRPRKYGRRTAVKYRAQQRASASARDQHSGSKASFLQIIRALNNADATPAMRRGLEKRAPQLTIPSQSVSKNVVEPDRHSIVLGVERGSLASEPQALNSSA